MAHFIPIIKNALKEFDEHSNSHEFYESIAWIGLKEYEVEEGVWQATVSWGNFSEERRTELNELYDDFLNDLSIPNCD